jgi:hypothetical protein
MEPMLREMLHILTLLKKLKLHHQFSQFNQVVKLNFVLLLTQTLSKFNMVEPLN